MAELALDDVQWDPRGRHVRGVGVAEPVGVDALLDAPPGSPPPEHLPDARLLHALAGAPPSDLVDSGCLPFTPSWRAL